VKILKDQWKWEKRIIIFNVQQKRVVCKLDFYFFEVNKIVHDIYVQKVQIPKKKIHMVFIANHEMKNSDV
jgi:hypothetical protein